jgi:RNA polymerase sigma-70 factor (ECF subfamily)
VLTLPPKERACVLLKDVFDYSLEEIAELVDSTVGGVKAALSRGRSKLSRLNGHQPKAFAEQARRAATGPTARAKAEQDLRVLQLYVERFNHRDWDGLRELIADDARLRVADRFIGRVTESPYFHNYARFNVPWRMAVGAVEGEPAVIVLHREADRWIPASLVRIDLTDGRIARIADYSHCPWVLPASHSLEVSELH